MPDVREKMVELEKAMERLGRFGELFVDYKGCSRGPMGRAGGVTLEEEVLLMPKITDVDGGEWIPVNAEALHELVERSGKLREERRWIPVTERLPDNLQTVLCYTNFDEVRMWQWNERWNSWIGLVADYGKNVVTHWMPLPKPPKGE